jgi:puromycin-sensitive aminopeptidase
LSVVAAHGGTPEYEATLERYRTARTPQDERRELFTLADFESSDLMDRTLQLAVSDDVKTQDAPFLLGRCVAHRDHGARAWRFLREHWNEAVGRFPANLIIRMVEPVTRLTRPEEYADVSAFLAEHPIRQAAKRVEQVLEREGVNVAMREREAPALAHAFD